ncbi:MAG: RNA polymerase sigma factor [Candidatus Limnocylindrales bacterium]
MERPIGWVIRVATSFDRSLLRRLRRQTSLMPEVEAPPDEYPVDHALVQMVWALPRRQRQAVAYRVLLDLSEQETGRLMGCSASTASVHLSRALQALRSVQADQPGEGAPWSTTTSRTTSNGR